MFVSFIEYPLDVDAFVDSFPLYFFTKRDHPCAEFHKRMVEILESAIRMENQRWATSKRKTLNKLNALLRESGHDTEPCSCREGETGIVVHMKNMDFFICRKRGSGISVSSGTGRFNSHKDWRESKFTQSRLFEEDLVSLLETIDEFSGLCKEKIDARLKDIDTQIALGKLSLPSVEVIVSERLAKCGFVCEVHLVARGNISLNVHMTGDLWLRHSHVTMDNLDKIIEQIPYLVEHSDSIARNGQGFRLVHWKKII